MGFGELLSGNGLDTLSMPVVSVFSYEGDPFDSSYSVLSNTLLEDVVFYIHDHLGNTRVTYQADKNGANVDYTLKGAFDYYPYGKTLRTFNPQEEKYLSTHHERDLETGFDYIGARFYDSDVARFLSLDPHAIDYPSLSDYVYVADNPLVFTDPNGKDIYYVGEDGEAILANEENMDGTKLENIRKTMLQTEDGSAIWSKYMNNEDHDVYIAFSSSQAGVKGKTVSNLLLTDKTQGSFNADGKLIDGANNMGVDSDGNLESGSISDEFSAFAKTNFSASKNITFRLISLSEPATGGSTLDLINGTEALFHEFKAHVDTRNHNLSETQEHNLFGAQFNVKNWGRGLISNLLQESFYCRC